jgi:hypothetical protein
MLYRMKVGQSEWLIVAHTLASAMKVVRRKEIYLPAEQEFEIFQGNTFLGNSRRLPLFVESDPVHDRPQHATS